MEPGSLGSIAGRSVAETFPGYDFNGLSVSYAVAGGTIKEITDTPGFATVRVLRGETSSRSVTVSGSGHVALKGHRASITIRVGSQVKSWENIQTPCTRSASLTVELEEGEGTDFEIETRLLASGSGGFDQPRIVSVGGAFLGRKALKSLQVVDKRPSPAAVNVPYDRPPVAVVFSDSILPNSVSAETFQVRYLRQPNVVIPVEYEVGKNRVVCHPIIAPIGKDIEVVLKGGATGIRGLSGATMAEDVVWTFKTLPELTINVIPVQVANDAPWIRKKAGVVRVTASWPFIEGTLETDVARVDANVRLAIDGMPSFEQKATFYAQRSPYHTPLGPSDTMRQGNAAVFEIPAKMQMSLDVLGEHALHAEVSPFGVESGAHFFRGEKTLTVTQYASPVTSVEDGYRILYLPVAVGTRLAGQTFSTAAIGKMGSEAALAMLPTPKVTYDCHDKAWDVGIEPSATVGRIKASYILRDLAKYSYFNHDVLVAVVPHAWITNVMDAAGLSVYTIGKYAHRAVFVSDALGKNAGQIVAHELGHVLGSDHVKDDTLVVGYSVAEKLYVDNRLKRLSYYTRDLMIEGITDNESGWPGTATYNLMVNALTKRSWSPFSLATPLRMLSELSDEVTGVCFVEGSFAGNTVAVTNAAIDAVYVSDAGRPSDLPGSGDHRLEMRDATGTVLEHFAFNAEIHTNDQNGTLYGSFMVAMPFHSTAREFVLSHADGTVRATRAASAHTPTVVVTAPTAGETLSGNTTVAWTAGDLDGDPLEFIVLYSGTGGATWLPVAMGVTNASSIKVNTEGLPGGTQSVFRVMAVDGFHTTVAESGTFTVRNPPRHMALLPAAGETEAPVDRGVEVIFRDGLDPSTIATSALVVSNLNAATVSGTVSYREDTRELVFTPYKPLAAAAQFMVTLDKDGVRDRFGVHPASNIVWTFTTQPDREPPGWVSQSPGAEATEVSLNTRIVLVFDEPLQLASVTNGGLRLTTDSGAPVAANLGYDAAHHAAWLQPASNLAAHAWYTACATGIADVAGNMIATNIAWTFRTGTERGTGITLGAYAGYDLLDDNADGLWDRLALRFAADLDVAGEYGLAAALVADDGLTHVVTSLDTTTALGPGQCTISAIFAADELRAYRPLNPLLAPAALRLYDANNALRTDFVPTCDVSIIVPTDMDGDGMPDEWELANGLSFTDAADAAADPDGDGLTTIEEYAAGTRWDIADTDGDTLTDGWEMTYGLNPTSAPPSWIQTLTLTHVASLSVPNVGMRDVVIVSNIAYVAAATAGLLILDVRDPLVPVKLALVDTPGNAYRVFVTNGMAYVADMASGFRIFDVRAPAAPVLLGSYDTPGSCYGIWSDGQTTWVADNTSLLSFDTRVPAAIVPLGSCNASGSERDVVVNGDYAYVGTSSENALVVVDVRDPANPVIRTQTPTGGSGSRVRRVGERVFVTGQNLQIIDIRIPTNLVLLASFDTPGQAMDLHMGRTLAFVADGTGGLVALDLREPGAPIVRGSVPNNFNAIAGDDRYLYAVRTDSEFSVYSWEVVDEDEDGLPDVWERLRFGSLEYGAADDPDGDGIVNWGEYQAGLDPNDGDEDGNGRSDGEDVLAYQLDPSGLDRDDDGLADTLEVGVHGTNPLDPATDGDGMPDGWEVRYGLNPLDPNDARADGDADFADNLAEFAAGTEPTRADTDGDSFPDGWEIRYATNPTNAPGPLPGMTVTPFAAHSGVSYAMCLGSAGNTLYVGNRMTGPLHAFDVTAAAAPVTLGSVGSVYPNALAIHGTHAYLACQQKRLYVVDVANPGAMAIRGTFATLSDALGVAVASNVAYVAVGSSGMQIVSIANPAEPVALGHFDTSGTAYDVVLNGTLAYVADGDGNGLKVVDVSVPSAPVQIAVVGGLSPRHLTLVSNRLYVAQGNLGLAILDVSNPREPMLLGTLDTPGYSTRVRVRDTLAYIAEGATGVQLVDVSNPSAPVSLAACDTPGTAYDVWPTDGYVYVADYSGGLRTLRVSPVDADSDGMADAWELATFGNLLQNGTGDADGDGLSNRGEYFCGLNATAPDQNANGIDDGREVRDHLMDPRAAAAGDVDGDSLSDWDEINLYGTSPTHADTDGDGMPDPWEIANGFNPLDPADGAADRDGDGVSNAMECALGLDPSNTDSDGDTLPDGWEVRYGTNANDADTGLDDVVLYELASLDVGGNVSDIKLVGNTLYVANSTYGLQVVDLSSPSNPVLIVAQSPALTGRCLAVDADTLYLTYEKSGSYLVRIVDIVDPTNPVQVATCAVPVSNMDIAAHGGYAYVAGYSTTIRIIDARVPASPVLLVGSVAGGYNVDSANGLLFTYGGSTPTRLEIRDLATPESPALLASAALPFTVNSLFSRMCAKGSNLLIGSRNYGAGLVDVSVATNPVFSAVLPDSALLYNFTSRSNMLFCSMAGQDGRLRRYTDVGTGSPRLADYFTIQPESSVPALDTAGNLLVMAVVESSRATIRVVEMLPPDTDGDGLPDWWELHYFGSLTRDAADDFDGDGISNLGEFRLLTDPTNRDQDGDGLDDGEEVRVHGTDPRIADADGDGLDDGDEILIHGTDPCNADSDGDGLDDGEEVAPGADGYVTDPNSRDTDGDGLSDLEEVTAGSDGRFTDPTRADTDGDGMRDGDEAQAGTDPLDPGSLLRITRLGSRYTANAWDWMPLDFQSVSNVAYVLQTSPTVTGVWLTVSESFVAKSHSTRLAVRLMPTMPRSFFRIRLSDTPSEPPTYALGFDLPDQWLQGFDWAALPPERQNLRNAADDPDGDGMDNDAERVAGTDPTDPASVLRITAFATRLAAGRVEGFFSACSRRTYYVESRLPGETAWRPVTSLLPGIDGPRPWQAPAGGGSSGFFRAVVIDPVGMTAVQP